MNKNFLALAIAGSLVAAVVVAQSIPPPSTFYGCRDGSGNVTSIREGTAPICKRGQTLTSWNNQGPQGLPGADGQDGAPGLGVRVWKDANGQTVGPSISGVNGYDLGYAELMVGTRRFAVPVYRLFDMTNPNRWYQTGYGAFLFPSGSGNSLALRYSPNSDCSPPHYFGTDDPYQNPVGYDVAAQYDRYGMNTPQAGRLEMLVLSSEITLTPINIKCTIGYQGDHIPGDAVLTEYRTLVQTINLTDTYPAPLSLQ